MTIAHNAEYTKQYNRKLILKFLLHHDLSRAELARKTGLSRAALSLIADELIDEGLIINKKPVIAKRGRTPIPLSLNFSAFSAIGIYLNRTSCFCGLFHADGNCLAFRTIELNDNENAEITLKKIKEQVTAFIAGFPEIEILGIGISAPGPLDPIHGRILNPTEFNSWHRFPIVERVSSEFPVEVCLENNACTLALFNKRFGNKELFDNHLLLLVDSGVGSGIIRNGKLMKGQTGFTSEIGHISIEYNGLPCACGNTGCLERYASIPHLLELYQNRFSTWKEVIDSYESENAAKEIVRQEAIFLSAGCSSLLNLIDLQAVVLAGDLSYRSEILITHMKDELNRRVLQRPDRQLEILPSITNSNTMASAAANLIFEKYFAI